MKIIFHEKNKRYLLFAGSWYYPSGGMGDFRDSYDTLEEATAAARVPNDYLPNESRYEWAHVFDTQENKVESIVI